MTMMNAAEFAAAIDALGLSESAAARVLGLRRQGDRAIRRMRNGTSTVTGPIAIVLRLMLKHQHIRADLIADLPPDVRGRIIDRAQVDYPPALSAPNREPIANLLEQFILLWQAFAMTGEMTPEAWKHAEKLCDQAEIELKGSHLVAWRIIDTAPKNGKKMLLGKIIDNQLWWAVTGFWSDKWQNWNDGVEPSGLAGPTHWMPISADGAGNME